MADDDERKQREARERMRKALDSVDLDPQQTSDDRVVQTSQDQMLRDEVPPHHGSA